MFQSLLINLRYLRALSRRFRSTLVLACILFAVFPLLFWRLYPAVDGKSISMGLAFHHVYFLLFGGPTLEFVDHPLLEALNLLTPLVGMFLLVDGMARFVVLFFAQRHNNREWTEVLCETLRDHVIVCGAGRIGYRVVIKLKQLGKSVAVIERKEDAAFVQVLRDEGVPVLVDDVRSRQAMVRANIAKAIAIVCATDDDLTNLNAALDARQLKPSIRVVVRAFDDDLVERLRDTLRAEAFSTSSLAAPAIALAALDPRIEHSFHVGSHLMVVSKFVAKEALSGMVMGDLRHRYGVYILCLQRAGAGEDLHPHLGGTIQKGDILTLQCEYHSYLKLRAFTHEVNCPNTEHATGGDDF